MTGPEHLKAGKRELACVDVNVNYDSKAMARVAVAQAHFAAAMVCLEATAKLHDYTSWQEAADR
jgi:hypothetical protein